MRILLFALLLPVLAQAKPPAYDLNIATFNTGLFQASGGVAGRHVRWFDVVPYTEDRAARLAKKALPEFLHREQIDLMILQEVWHRPHWEMIEDHLPSNYIALRPTERRNYGSGLMMIVRQTPRFTLQSWGFEPFRSATGVHAKTRKGALTARLKMRDEERVTIVGTHTQAVDLDKYGRSTDPNAARALEDQVLQLIEILGRESRAGRRTVILAGDLNVGNGYIGDIYDLFGKQDFINAFNAAQAEAKGLSWADRNSLKMKGSFGLFKHEPEAMIDHVLFRSGQQLEVRPAGAKLVFTGDETFTKTYLSPIAPSRPVPQKTETLTWSSPLSDHYGVKVRLELFRRN